MPVYIWFILVWYCYEHNFRMRIGFPIKEIIIMNSFQEYFSKLPQ